MFWNRIKGLAALVVLLSGCQVDEPSTELGRLEVGPPSARIGQLQGDVTFGQITDALARPEDIFVLDAQPPRLLRVDRSGTILQTVGREGDGPGEFRYPVAMDLGDSRLAVLDQNRSRVLQYEVGDSIRYEGEFHIPIGGFDLCLLEDEILVNGLGEGSSLHVYSWEGESLRSFEVAADLDTQDVDPTWEESIVDILRQGRIECRDPGSVLFLPEWSPVLTAMDARTGEHIWIDTLDGYTQVQWEGGENLSFGPDPEVNWAHQGVSVNHLNDDVVVVQLRRFGEAASTSSTSDPQEYRLLEIGGASQRRVMDTLPTISSSYDGLVLQIVNEPVPQVIEAPISVTGN